MPKSKAKRNDKERPATTKHFPSKPYMRAIRDHSPTTVPLAAWSTSDDELLLTSKTAGKKWVDICPLFPGKTSNACRKRHARLVTNAQLEWNDEREKDLAMEFVSAKVGFFKALARNLGLEWQQVEKKCIEMGFRTLLEKGKKCSPAGGSTATSIRSDHVPTPPTTAASSPPPTLGIATPTLEDADAAKCDIGDGGGPGSPTAADPSESEDAVSSDELEGDESKLDVDYKDV